MVVQFAPATKKQAKLRLALIGPSGSGKTFTALRIANGLADGGRIALIDTEHGSASKYSDKFTFDTLQLESYEPERYTDAIEAAALGGYSVLVIDSLSHAWAGKGGILEFVDNRNRSASGGNNFSAWRDATPKHNALVESILAAPLHLIVTMRSKMEYVQEKDEKGRTTIRKVGMQPVQREGMEYEFDVIGDVNMEHVLSITKTRFSDIADQAYNPADEKLGKKLLAWLSDGVAVPLTEKVQQFIPAAKPVEIPDEPPVGANDSHHPAPPQAITTPVQPPNSGQPLWWEDYNKKLKEHNVNGSHVAGALSNFFDEKIPKASGNAIQRYLDGQAESGAPVGELLDGLLAVAEGVRDAA